MATPANICGVRRGVPVALGGGRRRRRHHRRRRRRVRRERPARQRRHAPPVDAERRRQGRCGGALGQGRAELAERLVGRPEKRVEAEAAREVLHRARPLLHLEAHHPHQVEPRGAIWKSCRRLGVGRRLAKQGGLRLGQAAEAHAAQREEVAVLRLHAPLQHRDRSVRRPSGQVARREQQLCRLTRLLGVDALREEDGVVVQVVLQRVLRPRPERRYQAGRRLVLGRRRRRRGSAGGHGDDENLFRCVCGRCCPSSRAVCRSLCVCDVTFGGSSPHCMHAARGGVGAPRSPLPRARIGRRRRCCRRGRSGGDSGRPQGVESYTPRYQGSDHGVGRSDLRGRGRHNSV